MALSSFPFSSQHLKIIIDEEIKHRKENERKREIERQKKIADDDGIGEVVDQTQTSF